MPLLQRAITFDDRDWIFELKYDGFRALAVIEDGRAQLLSRNGHPLASFSALAGSISDSLGCLAASELDIASLLACDREVSEKRPHQDLGGDELHRLMC